MLDVFKWFCNKIRMPKVPPWYCHELCGVALSIFLQQNQSGKNDLWRCHELCGVAQYKINRKPSQFKDKPTRSKGQIKHREREKPSVRAKVEHIFGIVKGLSNYRNMRYKG